jgi:hypothetical protein
VRAEKKIWRRRRANEKRIDSERTWERGEQTAEEDWNREEPEGRVTMKTMWNLMQDGEENSNTNSRIVKMLTLYVIY